MSLQVWLPMNGSINNQGLSNITPSITGVSTTTSGKIADTCANFSNGNYIVLPNADFISTSSKSLSVAFWVKTTSTSTMTYFCDRTVTGEGISIFQIDSTTFRFDMGGVQTSFKHSLSFSNWTHLCFTADGSTKRLYVNGSLYASAAYSGTQASVGTAIYIGRSANDTSTGSGLGNPFIGQIQDYRIYDNALSAKEVKLLSQGLVAHYQLKGMGATNYLKGAGKFLKTSPLVRNANDTSVMNDSYVYHEWSPNDIFAVLPSAGTYTLSVECDGIGAAHPTSGTTASQRLFSFFLQNTSTGTHYHFAMSKGADGRWYSTRTDLVAGTYKVRTNLYAADNVNYTLKFWNMKITAGNYNPSDIWCPHSEDELYNSLGLGLGKEPDCSGFGNDATKGNISTIVNGSPRYGSCYQFNGSQYLACGRGAMVTDELTASCWAYSDNWASAKDVISCAEGGGWDFWANGSGQMTMEVCRNGAYITGVYPTALANWTSGWHHIVGVYDGYKAEIYVDGVKGTTSATTTTKYPVQYHASNGLFIGAGAGSSATTPAASYFTGKISDVRIYGTALSASDVADLYKNAASLTKDGKLMAYDFHENKRNTIDKTGIVATSGFNSKAIPTYDMKVKALDDGSTWARINHLDVTTAKDFFASDTEVAKCTDKHNRYSRMGIVDKYKCGSEYEFMLTYPSMKKTLPAGYTQLEYIEATGTQWINTGVTGTARWEFDIRFKTGISHRQLMGYGGDGQEYWGVQVHGGYGVHETGNLLLGIAAGNRDTIVHNYGENSDYSIWIQNKSVTVGGGDVSAKQYQLFTIMSSTGYTCHAKLWRCKCVQGGKLIRDFIPAIRNSDGYVGLLDVVNNVFYGNSGSGKFVAGNTSKSQSVNLYNRWIQTSSPNAAANTGTGFKAVSTSWTNYFTPITKSASSGSSLYSMNLANNWWAPIGQKATFNGGIPAADGSTQYETELWVRIDRFANSNQLKIYNGAITSTDYIEV